VTPLFALSVSEGNMRMGFPFDFGLSFYLCAGGLALCWAWSSRIPRSLDSKRA